MCGEWQFELVAQLRKMQIARLSVPRGARGSIASESSGQARVTRVLMNEPQMPSVGRIELVLKQMPRHWTLRGVVEPGTITVMRGLQGEPSGSRIMSTPFMPQAPVRALHVMPAAPVPQSLFCEQNGKQPVESGSPACVYHQPVQTKPARQAPVATVIAAGRHDAVQIELGSSSPCVRQVEPVPPQAVRSFAWEASFSQAVVQIGVVPVGMQTSLSPHTGSMPPIGSGIVQVRPAFEQVRIAH